jgi:hypothetical protein
MGSSIGFMSQHQSLRSHIAWSRPQRSFTALQGLADNHNYAASTDRSTQWQHLDRPLLWQGSETAALQAGALPSTLSPPWKVIIRRINNKILTITVSKQQVDTQSVNICPKVTRSIYRIFFTFRLFY